MLEGLPTISEPPAAFGSANQPPARTAPGQQNAQNVSAAGGGEQYLLPFNKLQTDITVVTNRTVAGSALSQRFVPRLSLLEAINTAKDYSVLLSVENSRLQQAEDRSGASFGGLLPKIDLRGAGGIEYSAPASITDNTGKPAASDTHTRYDTSIVLTQPVFDWEVFNQWQQQSEQAKAARFDFDAQFDNHIIDAVNTYLTLVQSRLTLNLTRDYDEQLNGLLRYVRTRSSAGVTSAADEDRVKGRVLNIKASTIEVEGQFEAALITFKRLTGVVPETIAIPQPLVPDVVTSVVEANRSALERNPDIMAAQSRLLAQDYNTGVAFGRYLPKLSLTLSEVRAINAGGGDVTQINRTAMLVGTWNILNGGADYYENRIAAERYSQQKFELEESTRKIQESLELTISAYTSTQGRIEAANREQEANLAVVKAYISQLQTGSRSVSDMLDAYQRLYQSRTDVVKLAIARARLAYQVLRLTGGLRTYFKF